MGTPGREGVEAWRRGGVVTAGRAGLMAGGKLDNVPGDPTALKEVEAFLTRPVDTQGAAGTDAASTQKYPLIVNIHGGPHGQQGPAFNFKNQVYAARGWATLMVNYRGSVGFGAAWRDTLIRNIGWPEVEDIVAGLDDLVAHGWTDPARAVIAGWSWGGYLTLLMHGMHPDRFIAGVAGVPVGDYEAAYDDESPLLQAYDRALFGGPPSDVPELIRERSPITYVDRVTAPLLVLAGEHDSRCPIRQVLNYTDRLVARDHDHELYLFPTGHAPFQIDERIKQTGVVLDFLARRVPGIRRLAGIAAVEALVKDSGAKSGEWSFYAFSAPRQSTPASSGAIPRNASCYACHGKNTAVEHTFVQFYPTLLPVARAKVALRIAPGADPDHVRPHPFWDTENVVMYVGPAEPYTTAGTAARKRDAGNCEMNPRRVWRLSWTYVSMSSGSALSESDVKPTRSQNSTVSWRRSPSSVAAPEPAGAGASIERSCP